MSETDPRAERYAAQHRQFLAENNPDVLRELKQSGDLNSYLSSVGEQAAQTFEQLMMRHANSKDVQSLPHQQRVQELRSRQHEVQEIVQHEIVFQPLPERDSASQS